MRLALTFAGRADHAGTTRRAERRDALAAAARLIVAADELAGGDPDFLVTAARMLVEPNAFTTVPSGVRLWIDGRTPDAERLARWRAELEAAAAGLAARSGVRIELATASQTDGVTFDAAVLRGDRRPPGARLLRRPRRRHPRPAPPGRAWCSSATRPASATRPRSTSSSTTRPWPPTPC